MPVAGKTGTSQDVHDQSFTGSTPYFTGSIWLGYDQPQRLRNTSSAHLHMWRAIMERVHADLPVIQFPRPEGVVSATVCRDSGMALTDLCRTDYRGSRAVTDLFVAGTVPSTSCTFHQEIEICTLTNMPASPYCPPDFRAVAAAFFESDDDAPELCDCHTRIDEFGHYFEDEPYYDEDEDDDLPEHPWWLADSIPFPTPPPVEDDGLHDIAPPPYTSDAPPPASTPIPFPNMQPGAEVVPFPTL